MDNSGFKLVIIGHIDHGKSTFIGRLLYDTGFLASDKASEMRRASLELGRETEFSFVTDCLREEREQNFTIETAQASFRTKKREYVIIDAPGHSEFVKNMITGAAQAEAALLIVDARRGIEEQTRRHCAIISLLGIGQVIVLINKMDLVDYSEEACRKLIAEIGFFLETCEITPQNYIPISAFRGDNIAKRSRSMPWHKGVTVLEGIDELNDKSPEKQQPLVFPVQDIYKVDNRRIVAGRLESGKISQGQKAKVIPQARKVVIKSIEKFPEHKTYAFAGECIGITTENDAFIRRGDILCEEEKDGLRTACAFRASMFWMSKDAYKNTQKLKIRCATQETDCQIERIHRRIDSSTLEVLEENAGLLNNLEIAEVTIRTKKPLAIAQFKDIKEAGRFVLDMGSDIAAAGIITKIE